MKILRVSAKNITTFDSFELDFRSEPLKSCGLFAITGPTGSGKSSLLDAICLSLYGRTPRYSNHGGIKIGRPDDQDKSRLLANDPRALMSYGAGFIETEVDFTRDHQRFYRARWYAQRSRKKPEGTFQNVSQELYEILSDDLEQEDHEEGFNSGQTGLTPVHKKPHLKLLEGTKVTEVRKRIEDTVGLKYEEFCRTVFLAQGEFDAFLKREEERSKLLELITGDLLYSKISHISQEKLKDAEEALGHLRENLDQGLLQEEELQETHKNLEQAQDDLNRLRQDQKSAQTSEVFIAQVQEDVYQYQELFEELSLIQNSQDMSLIGVELTEEIKRLYGYKQLLNTAVEQRQQAREIEALEITVKSLAEEEFALVSQEGLTQHSLDQLSELLERQSEERAKQQINRAELAHCEERLTNSEQQIKSIKIDVDTLDHERLSAQKDIAELEVSLNRLIQERETHFSKVVTQSHYQRLVTHQDRWKELFLTLHQLGEKETQKNSLLNEVRQQYLLTVERLKDLDHDWEVVEHRRKVIHNEVGEINAHSTEQALFDKRTALTTEELIRGRLKRGEVLLEAIRTQLIRIISVEKRQDAHRHLLTEKQSTYNEQTIELRLIEARLNELEQSLSKNDREKLLAPLRDQLVEGEPCFLCGSDTHDPGQLNHLLDEDDGLKERVESLTIDRDEASTQLAELQNVIKGEEQSLIIIDEQYATEKQRYEKQLYEWQDLSSEESWRKVSQDRPTLSRHHRLVYEDLLPAPHQINDELIQHLIEDLTTIEGDSLQKSESLNQAIAEMIHDQKRLQGLTKELNQEEIRIAQFEEERFKLEQDLQVMNDNGQQLNEQINKFTTQKSEIVSHLESFSPDLISSTQTSDLLALQEEWNQLCQDWHKEAQGQTNRLESIKEKQRKLNDVQTLISQQTQKKSALKSTLQELQVKLSLHQKEHEGLKSLVDRSIEYNEEVQKIYNEQKSIQISLEHIRAKRQESHIKQGELKGRLETMITKSEHLQIAYEEQRSKAELLDVEIADYIALWQSLDLEAITAEIERKEAFEFSLKELKQKIISLSESITKRHQRLGEKYRDSLPELARKDQEMVLYKEQEIATLSQVQKDIRSDLKVISGEIEQRLLIESHSKRSLDQHRQAVAKQGEESEEVQVAIANTNRLRTMAKVLGGAGKYGGFNAYAQRFTLEIIIEHANHYLKQLMSRYQLEMIDDDKKPLNFQVIDQDLGDEVRSVNSLSGGESFLISLALALGLSSTSSQNANIESLFIDEGFGTLDPESLDMAINMLDNLQVQGIQIGIISHVDGIAERVGTQVEVKKTSAGKSKAGVYQNFKDALSM